VNSWDEIENNLTAYTLTAIIALALAVAAWKAGKRLLLMPRLRRGRWTGATFVGHFILLRFCGASAITLLTGLGIITYALPEDASALRKQYLALPLAMVGFLAFSFTLLYMANRTPISFVGLSMARWLQNAALGALAFLVATPIVLAIFAGSGYLFPRQPHALEQIASQSLETFEWCIWFLQVIVFAPSVEEWLFRGLLQGWLRRTNLTGHAVIVGLTLMLAAELAFSRMIEVNAADGAATVDPAPLVFAALLATLYVAGVVALYYPVLKRGLGIFLPAGHPRTIAGGPDLWAANLFEAEGYESQTAPWSDFGPAWRRWKFTHARLAIVGSAMAFAVVHPWPTPIPIFVFGLVTGWLAFRTQNLVPGIVFHALFNLVGFITLWLQFHPGIIGSDDNVAALSPPGVAIVKVVPGVWWPR
jgi:membrane protease YdiL (CAAX protease family)